MKRIYLLLLFVLCGMGGFAQGVVFENLTFEQAVEKAKKEGKYVLLDLQSSTCVPCAMMEKQVLPLKEVGDYYNPRFVCVRFITDTTAEGKALSKKFGVKVVPTYIIVDGDGDEVHRKTSFMEPEKFIAWAERALGKKTNARYLYNRVAQGKKLTKEEKLLYFLALRDNAIDFGKRAQEVRSELQEILTEEDLLAPEAWEYLADDDYSTPAFKFVQEHAAQLLAGPDSVWVNRYLVENFTDTIAAILRYHKKNQPGEKLTGVCEDIAAIDFPGKKRLQPQAELVKAYYVGDDKALVDNMMAIAYSDFAGELSSEEPAYKVFGYFKNIKSPETKAALLTSFDELIAAYEKAGRPYTAKYMKFYAKQLAYGGGISYEYKTSLEDAVNSNKLSGKKIFVYLSMTHPMMGEIFGGLLDNDSIVNAINDRYTALRFDANSPDGQMVMRLFHLVTAPCYLVINSTDGNLVHAFAGVETPEAFLAELAKVDNPDFALGNLSRLAASNGLNRQQWMNYVQALRVIGNLDEANKQLNRFFLSLDEQERLAKDYWPALSQTAFGSEAADYLFAHMEELRKNVGEEALNEFTGAMYGKFNNNIMCVIAFPNQAQRFVYKNRDEALQAMEKLRKALKNDISANRESQENMLDMFQYCMENDFDKWLKAAGRIAEDYNPAVHSTFFPVLMFWAKDQCDTIDKVAAVAALRPKFIASMKGLDGSQKEGLALFAPFISSLEKAKAEQQ